MTIIALNIVRSLDSATIMRAYSDGVKIYDFSDNVAGSRLSTRALDSDGFEDIDNFIDEKFKTKIDGYPNLI